jgi:hypothetical protein
MAPFTHINVLGSRFSDGTYGVYYAAARLDTAIRETIHHFSKFASDSDFFLGVFAAGCLAASALLVPSVGHAQADPRVTKSMESLKGMTAKLGTPKLEGNEAVGGKEAPALYFGTTKINNNFDHR